jgi:hypothetical protein
MSSRSVSLSKPTPPAPAAINAACDCITPFGLPVVPEV